MRVNVKILFFAKARELAGCSEATLNVEESILYGDLLEIIVKTYSLEDIRNNVILAVNEEYSDTSERILLKTGDEIAIIPPISGVSSHCCGAISIFVGTTRDNFQGKTVTQLQYEAYENMAITSLQKICAEIRERWSSIVNIAIYHRLGVVPVKEASIVIAISSPHRNEALTATQWCIDNIKEKVPIWKKEFYENESSPEWKENKEFQIKASREEIEERIDRFMKRKRDEINRCNVKDFCMRDIDVECEDSCARIDSVLIKRKDSKGHLQGKELYCVLVNRMYNAYCYRDQNDMEYLAKYIPPNGIEERVKTLEHQLSLTTPVPRNIYERLKELEDRLLHLESISPEYMQFWYREKSCK
ncbi:molybdopterin synthase related [Holotrichia oblita]|uniref:Molybdopterin synthase related n=1 Tax=Holotrichia oblita TaxID=644536 RepID=A0ACB9TR49_HOLOL|nr:molybdopterin synthase related [Holotrichia oblita]